MLQLPPPKILKNANAVRVYAVDNGYVIQFVRTYHDFPDEYSYPIFCSSEKEVAHTITTYREIN